MSGALAIAMEGTTHARVAGTGLEIAPGLAHRFENVAAADAAFRVISRPASHGARAPAPAA